MEQQIAIRPVEVKAYRDQLQPGFWLEFRGMDDEGRKYSIEMLCGDSWKQHVVGKLARISVKPSDRPAGCALLAAQG